MAKSKRPREPLLWEDLDVTHEDKTLKFRFAYDDQEVHVTAPDGRSKSAFLQGTGAPKLLAHLVALEILRGWGLR